MTGESKSAVAVLSKPDRGKKRGNVSYITEYSVLVRIQYNTCTYIHTDTYIRIFTLNYRGWCVCTVLYKYKHTYVLYTCIVRSM